jgi:PAS domain S-box-containing protein
LSEHLNSVHVALSSIEALSGIIDAVPHPIFVKDEETRFIAVNQAMCRLMGRTHAELVGATDYDFVPREQAEIYRHNDILVLSTGEANGNEELFTDGEGRLRIIVTEKKRLVLPGGARLIVGCITDISAFRHAEALILHNAEHDALTGLVNRRVFQRKASEAVSEALAGGPGASILLIDLDRFKPVNDVHGHTIGDAVLCAVASRLTASVRDTDTVARLGGDEFAVLYRCGEGRNIVSS